MQVNTLQFLLRKLSNIVLLKIVILKEILLFLQINQEAEQLLQEDLLVTIMQMFRLRIAQLIMVQQ